MENKIKNNLKIDKRIRAIFGEVELGSVTSSPASTREGIMADQDSEEAKQGRAILEMVNNASHYKEVVPHTDIIRQVPIMMCINTPLQLMFQRLSAGVLVDIQVL